MSIVCIAGVALAAGGAAAASSADTAEEPPTVTVTCTGDYPTSSCTATVGDQTVSVSPAEILRDATPRSTDSGIMKTQCVNCPCISYVLILVEDTVNGATPDDTKDIEFQKYDCLQ